MNFKKSILILVTGFILVMHILNLSLITNICYNNSKDYSISIFSDDSSTNLIEITK